MPYRIRYHRLLHIDGRKKTKMTAFGKSFLCVVIILLAGGWSNLGFSQPPYQVITVTNGGTVQGVVRLKTAVPMDTIPVTKDQQQCGTNKAQPAIQIGKENGLANAVVYLKGILKGKGFEQFTAPVLDQMKCEFTPHIILVPPGVQLTIENSDPILHNVHTYKMPDQPDPKAQGLPTLFNIALPIQGLKIPKIMEGSGKFLTLCDAGHPWMNAYIIIMENPYYAVSDADGHFSISGVPPGTYELRVWHEGAAKVENNSNAAFLKSVPIEQSKQISVAASKTTTVNFEISFP